MNRNKQLYKCVANNDCKAVKLLLKENKISTEEINSKNMYGYTLLEYSINVNCEWKMIKYILKNGKYNKQQICGNENTSSLIIYLLVAKRYDIVKLLLQYFDCTCDDFIKKDMYNQNMLSIIFKTNSKKIIKYLITNNKINKEIFINNCFDILSHNFPLKIIKMACKLFVLNINEIKLLYEKCITFKLINIIKFLNTKINFNSMEKQIYMAQTSDKTIKLLIYYKNDLDMCMLNYNYSLIYDIIYDKINILKHLNHGQIVPANIYNNINFNNNNDNDNVIGYDEDLFLY